MPIHRKARADFLSFSSAVGVSGDLVKQQDHSKGCVRSALRGEVKDGLIVEAHGFFKWLAVMGATGVIKVVIGHEPFLDESHVHRLLETFGGTSLKPEGDERAQKLRMERV